jgi:hypothetical protein
MNGFHNQPEGHQSKKKRIKNGLKWIKESDKPLTSFQYTEMFVLS